MDSSGTQADTIAAHFGRYIAGLRYEQLPKSVIDATKALILDQLACQLIGSTVPWVAPALQLVELSDGAAEESTIVNRKQKALVADAVFANATFGQACELDDTAYRASGHIGAATVPIALALGERDHIDGKMFLTSIVAGYDVMYRILRAVTPFNVMRGFQSQGTGGPFAAAATAAKILGLDPEQCMHALAIAGSHSVGPVEYDQSGGEVKRFHAGISSRGGLHSALLAQFGLTGPSTIIEGKRGFCAIFATQSDQSQILTDLGKDFMIINTSFKMYPVVKTLHTAIAAVARIVAEHDVKPSDVARIRIGFGAHAVEHGAGIGQPKDVIGAQFSIAFSLGLAIVKRSNDLVHYMNPQLWSHPEMVRLGKLIECSVDPEAVKEKKDMATATIDLVNGKSYKVTEEQQKGTPPNPASDAEIDAKVRGLAGAALPKNQVDKLIAIIRDLENVRDVSQLAALLVPAS
jgi:2-methylcitrate dehydratase PrpD